MLSGSADSLGAQVKKTRIELSRTGMLPGRINIDLTPSSLVCRHLATHGTRLFAPSAGPLNGTFVSEFDLRPPLGFLASLHREGLALIRSS